MKINKNLIIELLQNELIYERSEHKTALADLETEERIQKALEEEVIRLFGANTALMNQREKLKEQQLQLNTDFFDLGDMLMEAVQEKQSPKLELKYVLKIIDEFLGVRYQVRIEYLEELIFELGDEVEEEKSCHEYVCELLEDIEADMAEYFSESKKDTEDLQADMAEDFAKMIKDHGEKTEKLKTERNDATLESASMKTKEVEKLEGMIEQLKRDAKRNAEEAEMKEKVHQEGIYADKKCKYDLEQKIAALQEENKNLHLKSVDIQGSSLLTPKETAKKAKEALSANPTYVKGA